MGNRSKSVRLSLVVSTCLAGTSVFADCSYDEVELRGTWGQARFSVEVADTDEKRAVGLMNRETLATSAGMLFAYDKPRVASFWMKNTLIPLDMIFMDSTGRVHKIHENAIPHDTSGIYGGDQIQYVLEINGGLSEKLGITEGSELRHPIIPSEVASWPCDPSAAIK